MYSDRLKRILIPSFVLFALTVVLVLVGMMATSAAGAAPRYEAPAARLAATVQTRDAIVEFGDSVFIAEDEQVKSAFAFGGDITVAGTVTHTVVAFGGDVRLLPTADVGASVASDDPSVVSMGGTITVEDGAQVNGQLQRLGDDDWPQAVNVAVPDIVGRPWTGFSFLGWLVQTAVFLVLGLVAAALLPKQMLAVGRSLSSFPGASLGWGALGFFIVVPVAALVLLVSIIGILVLLPGLVVVPLFYFFVALSVAVFIVRRLLARSAHGQNIMLVTALGVLGTAIVSSVPVAGALAVLAMILFGTGAAYLAAMEWRRGRKAFAAPVVPPPSGGPAPSPSSGPATTSGADSLPAASSDARPSAASPVPASSIAATREPPLPAAEASRDRTNTLSDLRSSAALKGDVPSPPPGAAAQGGGALDMASK